MTDLRFIIQLAAKGVRVRARLNGMVVAYVHGTTPAALARDLGPFLVRGKNAFIVDVELVPPPPPPVAAPAADEPPFVLDLAIHAPGGKAPLSDVTLLLHYSLTENELPPGNGPHEVVSYVLPLGSDGDGARAWTEGADIPEADAASVVRAGLAECLRVLEGRDAAALSSLVALHAKDHADQRPDVPVDEATFDLLSPLIPLLAAPDYRVQLAPEDQRQLELLFGGKAVAPRARGGAPPLLVTAGETTLGLFPTFSILQGNARVVRWC